jgi:hypothetical protein
MVPALFKEQPREKRTVEDVFKPLKKGKPVALRVRDPRMPKKARIPHPPMLLLAPLSMYGGPKSKLVISLEGRGCEIVDVAESMKAMTFYRVGLNLFLSSALANAMQLVFKGDGHGTGTRTQARPGSSARKEGSAPRKSSSTSRPA